MAVRMIQAPNLSPTEIRQRLRAAYDAILNDAAYRDNPVYKMALAVGDPEPWPEEREQDDRETETN